MDKAGSTRTDAARTPTAAKATWHFSRDGNRQGPVVFEALKHLVACGEVKATDLVWKEGMAEWVPVAAVPSLAVSPPVVQGKPARRIKPIAAAVAALAFVGLVAVLLITRPWRKEPVYAGRPLSEWGERLKDANPSSQREAVEALGSIGMESYRYIPEMMTLLFKTDDTNIPISIVKCIRDIRVSAINGYATQESMAVAAEKEVDKALPGLVKYRDHVEMMLTNSRSALIAARTRGESSSTRPTCH